MSVYVFKPASEKAKRHLKKHGCALTHDEVVERLDDTCVCGSDRTARTLISMRLHGVIPCLIQARLCKRCKNRDETTQKILQELAEALENLGGGLQA